MYKIAICDDSPGYILYLKKLITTLHTGNVKFYEYASGKALLQQTSLHHDIIILDIQLGDSNGNQVAAQIRQVNRDALLVLCSGVVKPTPMSFVVDTYRYLIKSDSDQKTLQVLKEIFDEADRRFHKDFLNIVNGDVIRRIRISSIVYISKIKYGSEVHVSQDEKNSETKVFVSKNHLDVLYEELKAEGFEYAHSSYIVNSYWIKEIHRDHILLYGGEILTVSRTMRKRFMEAVAGSLARKYS